MKKTTIIILSLMGLFGVSFANTADLEDTEASTGTNTEVEINTPNIQSNGDNSINSEQELEDQKDNNRGGIGDRVREIARDSSQRMSDKVHQIREETGTGEIPENLEEQIKDRIGEAKEKDKNMRTQLQERTERLSQRHREQVETARNTFNQQVENLVSGMEEEEKTKWVKERIDRIENAIERFENHSRISDDQREKVISLLENIYTDLKDKLNGEEKDDEIDLEGIMEDIIGS
ncbi:hypothetical protein [Candidatus Absconditicoccus praedator]|uniref:hypothetical protein n=1 Tax=Candidatus Absconditicoccus praedator TaxID=2735562 RepID=UPI001E389E71|nr:hypothetical protein [Candidatus Absconditicoccus praedator]UFX83233.1 hypothetical protein HLG78_03835 [Candidatus Absconditicoccus praedator]